MNSERWIRATHVALLASTLASSGLAQTAKTSPTQPAPRASSSSSARPATNGGSAHVAAPASLASSSGARLVTVLTALPQEKQGDAAALTAAAATVLGASTTLDSVFEALWQFQRTVATTAQAQAAAGTHIRIVVDNATIDDSMKQGAARFDHAMNAAWMELAISTVAASVGTAGAASAAPASTPPSDFTVVATAEGQLERTLPASVLNALRARLADIAARMAKAWASGSSTTVACDAAFASDPVLAKADRASLLVVATYLVEQKAIDDLRAAIRGNGPRQAGSPFDSAMKRLVPSLTQLRAIAQQLRRAG
jgi:hypothetical protein